MAQTHKEIITTAISFKYVHFCTFNSSIMDEPMEDRQTKPLSEFWGWDLGLLGGIGTSRLRFGLQGGDLGLQARIWAFRLKFGPQDCNLRRKLSMCESIGHRPLRVRCPALSPNYNHNRGLVCLSYIGSSEIYRERFTLR